MSTWADLEDELDRWHDDRSVATFWWRDDDAADVTAELDVLLHNAQGLPLALAVVPALATEALARRLAAQPVISVLQHGWRHADHACGRNNEYPAERPFAEVAWELAEGRRILQSLFGRQAIPVFVPPWHGFEPCFLSLLEPSGLRGISRKAPRAAATAAPGVLEVNAHLAAITWTDPPSYGAEETYLTKLLDHLRGRYGGSYDRSEPTGLLTHHLVQDQASFDFVAHLVETTRGHPAAEWIDIKSAFPPA